MKLIIEIIEVLYETQYAENTCIEFAMITSVVLFQLLATQLTEITFYYGVYVHVVFMSY